MKQPFEYVVANDGSSPREKTSLNFGGLYTRNQIKDTCIDLSIKCVDVPPELHMNRERVFPNTSHPADNHPGSRHTVAIQYVFNMYSASGRVVILLDSDMFLLKPFDINEHISQYDLIYQSNKKEYEEGKISICYIWPGFAIMNTATLPNLDTLSFDGGVVIRNDDFKYPGPSCKLKFSGYFADSGGNSYWYLKNNRDRIKIRDGAWDHTEIAAAAAVETYFIALETIKKKYSEHNCEYVREFFLDSFIHIRRGSNWLSRPHQFYMDTIDAITELLRAQYEKHS